MFATFARLTLKHVYALVKVIVPAVIKWAISRGIIRTSPVHPAYA